MWKLFFVIATLLGLFSRPAFGQSQEECEQKMLKDSRAEQVLSGPEHEVFMRVVSAFKLTRPPRLYFFPGNGRPYYVVGSVFSDGRGMILISENFVILMGRDTPALQGVLAHEVAHLVSDNGSAGCRDWIMRDPRVEEAADVLASSKVGFDPLRAFLSRVIHLANGKGSEGVRLEAMSRLSNLDSLRKAQKERRR